MACENGIQVPFLFFVFAWHWKTDLNFAFCFSFSPKLWKTDLNFVFRFSFSYHFEKRIWISFLVFALLWKTDLNFVFVWLVIEKQIWISFVVFAWLEKRISAPVQSFEAPGHAHPRGWPGHSLFMQVKASEFYSPWGQSEKWTPPPPPHDMSYKHGTPFFNKGWLVIRWQPRKKPVSVKRRLRTRGKMQRECKMLTADWE